MKKIGLLGGLGPEATIDYYKQILHAFQEGNTDLNYPEMIIYSVNMSEFIGMMKKKDYPAAVDYLLEKIHSIHQAGADFAVLTANTPHLFFDELKEKSPLPLISIVEVTCRECVRRNLKKPGLFGTGFTMNSSFYQEVFEKAGLKIEIPDEADRNYLNEKLFTEIELGIFKEETRQGLIKVIEKMKREKEIDSIILGCTEFPLILTEDVYAGIPALNTTQIHVDELVQYCREGQVTTN